MESVNSTRNTKRIAKNTILLYFRMLLLMVLTLYTSRVILNALGVEDYGVYNAVGGFISLFAILTNTLSAAISRFLTFELGKKNSEKLNKIFSSSITILIFFSFIIFVIAETIGIWFLTTKMNIPLDREVAAHWVFQFSVCTFLLNIIGTPFIACIIAHERMGAFAYISIFDGTLRLIIALLIASSTYDRLIFYAILQCLLALVIQLCYGIYSWRKFNECHYRFVYDKRLFREILGFSGWNFIGAGAGVLNDHGINILLNIFFGPVVNTARAIAVQVNQAVVSFSTNFMTALNPQITKSYASGDSQYMTLLAFNGARFSCYLLIILSIPLIVETPFVLKLWLGQVPDYSVVFVRLVLINAIYNAMSGTLVTIMLATGDIKKYQIIVGGLQLLGFPLSWALLKSGFPPESTIIVLLGLNLISLFVRLTLLNQKVSLDIKPFLSKVLFKVTIVLLLSFIFPFIISSYYEESIIRLICNGTLSFVISCIIIYGIGCSKEERLIVRNKICNYYERLKKSNEYAHRTL